MNYSVSVGFATLIFACALRYALREGWHTIVQVAHEHSTTTTWRGAEKFVTMRWRIELPNIFLACRPQWTIVWSACAVHAESRWHKWWWRRR